jgi:heme exporter protein D
MEKGKIKELKIPISLVMIAITLFLTILTVIYFFSLLILPSEFSNFLSSSGGWAYYIFLVAFIGFLYFAYLLVQTVNDRRKFEELIASDSKSIFVKNVRDLDVIARRLGPSFKKRLENKKEQLRVKY